MEVFGRYQLNEQLGHGGMGVVYRAFDTMLERIVALKLVAATYGDDPEMRERFLREARAAARLTHKNIVTVYDLSEHEGRLYLAMEYLAGEDLQRRLARPDKMPLSRKLEVAIEICQGVEHAHLHSIIHRDLKPANIFLTESGGVKLLDFGLARPVTSQLTQSHKLMGTPNYMAPEQIRGERADQRSDIFSLGVVLYEMFGGRKAFEGDSIASTLYKILEVVPEPLSNFDAELPPELCSIIDRAIAKSREDRYGQVSMLLGDLTALQPRSGGASSVTISPLAQTMLSGDVAGVSPKTRIPSSRSIAIGSSPAVEPAPAARSSRTVVAAGIVALLAVAAVAGWLYSHRAPAPPAPPVAQTTATPPVSVPEKSAPPAQAPSVTAPSAGAENKAAGAMPAAPDPDAVIAERDARTARGRMLEGRAAAEAAGAPARAAASFRNASRRGEEADRLFKSRDFAAAASRYYEASGLFRESETSARAAATPPAPHGANAAPPTVPSGSSARGAGATPSSPAANAGATSPAPSASPPAVQPAAPPMPPVAPPVTPPRTPATAPAQPSAPVVTDEQRVNDLLGRYRDALEARSLDQLKRIWPSLSGAGESAIRAEFQHASRISVEIASPQVALSGGAGKVTFVRNYSLTTKDGQQLQSSSHVTMDVRRTAGGWVVDAVRFSPR